jgi:uncharacterized protein (TIGR03435 family)
MLRIIYIWLIRLHPPYFRKRFADEMLFIFGQESGWLAAFRMVADGAWSLLRQWTVRHEFWREPDLKIASESGPSFRTLDDTELPKGAWFKGIALSASVFCVFWLAIVFGQNKIPQSGRSIVGKYGLAVLSPMFDPNNFQSGTDANSAQSADKSNAPVASFEVASIKPNLSGRGGVIVFGNINPPPGPIDRFVTTSTVKRLIEDAYGIQDSQLTGGPSWVNSERYDIDAKVPDSVVADAIARKLTRTQQLDQVRLMLQSLLADRFKLKVSHETKDLPVYAVVLAKGGLKLAPVTGTPPAMPPRPPGEEEMAAFGPVSTFTSALPLLPEVSGRTVIDRTGLKGDYFWTLHWTPENPDLRFGGPAGAGAPQPGSGGPSLFTAIQEQLGLRLESTKGPVDVLVIDHVEQPTPN